jgi:hypothetical protein
LIARRTSSYGRVDDKREDKFHKAKAGDTRHAKKMQEGAQKVEPPSCMNVLLDRFAYCAGALELPIFVPITSPEIMISTLRFC